MATRRKPSKSKEKLEPVRPTRRKSSKKVKSIGGEVGPWAWIIAGLVIGYLGWAVSQVGMR